MRQESMHIIGKLGKYAAIRAKEVEAVHQYIEAHRQYLDIHVIRSGEERMDIAETSALTPDDAISKPENDFYAFTDKNPAHQSIILKHGDFLVAFPQDAHRVKGQVNGPSDAKKIVSAVKAVAAKGDISASAHKPRTIFFMIISFP